MIKEAGRKGKRKRHMKSEETTDEEAKDNTTSEKRKKEEFKIKYIGETSRSAYERSKEHWNAFKDLSFQSHMLKHYFLDHEDIEMDDLEFGIRVTGTYRSAIERQIGEAVKIEREVRKGKNLLNSKSEFNRCELPRLTVGTRKETLMDLQEDDKETRTWKEKVRKLKKRKKDDKIEKEMRNPSLHRVCLEILNQDDREWQRKKRRIEERKKEIEEDEELHLEKIRRLRKAELKKKELLKELRKKGKVKLTEKERERIEQRKKYWRNFRERNEDFNVDENQEAGDTKIGDAGCIAAASEDIEEKKKPENPKEEKKKKKEEAERANEGRSLGNTRKDIEYPETLSLKNSNSGSKDLKNSFMLKKAILKSEHYSKNSGQMAQTVNNFESNNQILQNVTQKVTQTVRFKETQNNILNESQTQTVNHEYQTQTVNNIDIEKKDIDIVTQTDETEHETQTVEVKMIQKVNNIDIETQTVKNIDIDSISKVNSDKGNNEKVSHEYAKDKKDKMTSQKGENDKMVSKDNKNNKSVVLPDADLLRINSDKGRIDSHEDKTKEKDKMTDHKGGKVSKDIKNNKGIVLSSGTDSKEISQAEKKIVVCVIL